MYNALVTGCNGFVGQYLLQSLIKDNYIVTGVDLQDEPGCDGIEYKKVDLSNSKEIHTIFTNKVYDEIYHLAAIANPRQAKENPELAYQTSVTSTIGLLEGIRNHKANRILFIGSSEEYKKKGTDDVLFSEGDELEPSTIYSSTKIICELIAKSYISQFGIQAIFTRSFNHTGAGQSPVYVLSDFAKQIAEIKLGLRPKKLVAGNIDLERDFLDVRDVVLAYRLLMKSGNSGSSYNVCSGKSVSLRTCINIMLSIVELDDVNIDVDPTRLRINEIKKVRGSTEKLRMTTGWEPVFTIEKTLVGLLEYWLKYLHNGH